MGGDHMSHYVKFLFCCKLWWCFVASLLLLMKSIILGADEWMNYRQFVVEHGVWDMLVEDLYTSFIVLQWNFDIHKFKYMGTLGNKIWVHIVFIWLYEECCLCVMFVWKYWVCSYLNNQPSTHKTKALLLVWGEDKTLCVPPFLVSCNPLI